MRILMITALDVWALAGGGGAPSLYKTLEAYGRRGHDVDVVSPTLGANHHHGEPPIPHPQIVGVRFNQFELPSLAKLVPLPAPVLTADQKLRFALVFPWLASRRAEHLAAAKSYDVLYGYEVHGLLAQRLLRRDHRDLPLVARFQGTIMRPYLDDRVQLARRFEEVLALKTPADLYIMTNDGTQGDEVLERLNPASAGKVRFWRNGLDLQNSRGPTEQEAAGARKSLAIADDDFVLVTAARLARWKRIDRAIDALALLRPKLPRARLFVVGDGEERANLEAQAAAVGLSDAVTFTGAVPQLEVQRYLWAADVFLSLNELSNVGNPLLEAMATARCILTIDEGDTRALIRDGETGALLSSGNPQLIADSIWKLAQDHDVRATLGRAAKEFADREFWSWDQRMAAEVDAVEALVRDRAAAESGAHV
ncbi:MAG TPA: glycosyltransferase family 4 protein [Dehalococcoidia bacterium]